MPADEMRRVRSRMPGRVASGTCGAGGVGEGQVLVHLVGDGVRRRAPGTGSATSASSVAGEDLAGRVVRRVQQHQAGTRAERAPQLVGVEPVPPVRSRAQRHRPPDRAGERDRGGVRVVVGLEAHDLVAGLAQREDAAAIASVAPAVTTTSPSGSYSRPQNRSLVRDDRRAQGRDAGPAAGTGSCPPRRASAAAASISGGPSVSGKPWPRLTEPVRTASADISAKIVVPNGRMRATRGSAGIERRHGTSLIEHYLRAGRRWRRSPLPVLLRHFLAVDGRPAADRAGVVPVRNADDRDESGALHGGGRASTGVWRC